MNLFPIRIGIHRWLPRGMVTFGGLLALLSNSVIAAGDPLPFTFLNSSGESSSQIWVQFRGGLLDGYYLDQNGAQQQLDMSQSYSLDQLSGNGNTPQVFINGFESGRIYVNYGMYGLQGLNNLAYAPAAQTPTDPNYNTRYQYFEATVLNRVSGPQVYADLSYIDFTSISFSMDAVKNGQINTAIPNNSQQSQNSNVLISAALSSVSAGNQPQVILPSGASATTPNSSFARVISPVFDPTGSYPSFAPYTDVLKNWGPTTLLSGDFGGNPSATQAASTIAQTYGYKVSFEPTLPDGTTANDNTEGYIVLTSTSWSGQGLSGGTGEQGTKIYLGINDLTQVTSQGSTGIYGNNPSYIVYNSGNGVVQSYQPLGNDVFGRVVGDLLAGMNLGYVASEHSTTGLTFNVVNETTGESEIYTAATIGELPSTLWWAGGASSGNSIFYDEAGTKYSVDWGNSVAGKGLTYADVQPGSTTSAAMYNYYSAALAAVTDGYGFPLGDRLGENLLSFIRGPGQAGSDTNIRLTINPDGTQALTTYFWNGSSDGNWTNGGNWTTNNGSSATPSSGATIQFGASGNTTVNTGTVARDVDGIYFNYGADSFTIQGGQLNLSGNIINSSSQHNIQTIENDIALGADSLVGAASGDLVLSGNLTLTDATKAYTMVVAGNGYKTTLGGTISDGTTAGGQIIKMGTGTLELSGTGNSFSGGLDVQGGKVIIGADSAAGTGLLSLGITSATAVTPPVVTLSADGGGTRNLGNQVDINGNVNFEAESAGTGFAFSGDVSLAGSSSGPLNTRILTVNTDVVFNGSFSGSSAYILVKEGTGTLTLGGSSVNNLAAPIFVNEGGLTLAKTGGSAYSGNLTIGDGSGTAASAVVTVQSANQTPTSTSNTLTIDTDGRLVLAAGTGVGNIVLKGGSITSSGGTQTLTVTDEATVSFVGDKGTSSTIGANVALATSTHATTFQVNNSSIAGPELEITGGLSGSGINLVKTGNGQLLLSGDNSGVTGGSSTVTVGAGLLRTTSIANATLSVGVSGSLGTLANGTAETSTFNAVNSAAGSSFAVELGDSIEATGSITLGSDNVFYFSGASATAGTYNVMQLTGGVSATFNESSLTFLSTNISGLSGSFNVTGKTLQFVATVGNTGSWVGLGGDGNWSTSSNWQGSAVPLAGSNISFSGSPAQTMVNIGSGNLNVGSVTFAAGSAPYTLSGSGSVLLNGDIINNAGGTQTISSDIYLTSDRSFTTASGGTLSLGTVHLSYNGAVVGELTIDGDGNTNISGSISDAVTGGSSSGTVVKEGTGTLTFSNAGIASTETFSGQFSLNGGTVNIASSLALGDDSTATNILDINGGTIQINNGSAITFGTAGWTGRSIVLESGGGTFDIDGAGSALTINGAISGSGNLTKTGSGSLTLPDTPASSAANSYEGATLVQEGTLVINNVNSLGSSSAGTTISSGATLELNVTLPANATTATVADDFSIAGTGVSNNGAIYLSAKSVTLSGEVTLTGDALIKNGGTNSEALQLKDIQTGSGSGYTLTVQTGTSNTVNITGALQGAGNLRVSGPGTVTLSGNSMSPDGMTSLFTGSTTVSSGILALSSATALGTGTDLTIDSGAVLNFTGTSNMNLSLGAISLAGDGIGTGATMGAISNNAPSDVTLEATSITLTGNASLMAASGTLTVNAPVNMSTYDLTLNSMNVLNVAGGLTGSGQVIVNATGGGYAVLSGDNSGLTGSIDITSGVLVAAQANALGGSSSNVGITVGASSTLAFGANGGSTDYTFGNTGTISIAGPGYAGGAIYNVSGNNEYTGGIDLTGAATIAAASGTKLTLASLSSSSPGFYAVIGGGGTVYAKDLSSYGASQIQVVGGSTFASGTSTTPTNLTGTQLILGQMAGVGTGAVAASVGTYSPGEMGTAVTSTFQQIVLQADDTTALSRLVMDLGDSASDKIVVEQGNALPDVLAFHFNYTATAAQTYTLLQAPTSTPFGGNPTVASYTFTYEKGQSLSGYFQMANSNSELQFNASSQAMSWDNNKGNGLWGDNNNWTFYGASGAEPAAFVPAAGSAVAFTATGGTESLPIVAATGSDQFVGNLTFLAGSTNIDIQDNTLHVHQGIANDSGVVQTISSDINIVDDVDIVANSGDLALKGSMTVSNGTVRFSGTNNTTVAGGIADDNASDTKVTKEGTGRLILEGTSTYTGTTEVKGGTLLVNGTTAAGNLITVDNGGTLGGSGTIGGGVVVAGTLSPGNSPAILSTGGQQWLDGGNYVWQLYDATGAAGTGWDSVAITGSLDLSSLAQNGFTIDLETLSALSPDVMGAALNFDSMQEYSWNLATATGGILGFDTDKIAINATNFANPINPGWGFSLEVQGNNLVLGYSAVPEPSTIFLLGLGMLVIFGVSVRRRKAAALR